MKLKLIVNQYNNEVDYEINTYKFKISDIEQEYKKSSFILEFYE